MTNEKFNEIVEDQFAICNTLLNIKNIEYKGEIDRFHTFNVAAKMQNITPKQALAGMMAKHTASIYDMCREGKYSVEKWTEKITDHINYLVLLKALIIEEIRQEESDE